MISNKLQQICFPPQVQELKKENKLWTSDHLFLRETLLIPLTSDNESLMDVHDAIVVCDGRQRSFTSNGSGDNEYTNKQENILYFFW